jgi:hypothetical protein
MRVIRGVAIAFFSSLALFCVVAIGTQQPRDADTFACAARSFSLEDFDKGAVVPSPDSKKHISLNPDGSFGIFVGQKQIGTRTYSVSVGEVGWSPDSTHFFISYSDGGAVGTYLTHVFSVSEKGVIENSLTRIAFNDFKSRHYCEIRGNNLFFLGWTPDSQNVFLVTEVYPTSDCKEWSRFAGYLMDVTTNRIIRRYSERDTTAIEKSCRASGILKIH